MFVFALVYVCFSIVGMVISWQTIFQVWFAWLLYYAVLEYAHYHNWLHNNSTRGGWLARAVWYWFDASFTPESTEVLKEIDADMRTAGKQFIFACEPHAPQCLQLTLGFAGHAAKLPSELSRRVRVVAHTSTRFIPLVREILSLYGVVGAGRYALERLLNNGDSLALIPSGVYGKEHALLDRTQHSSGVINVYRRRERFGFLYLAVKHRAAVVPVLSPDELTSYELLFQQFRAWPLVLPIGRHLLAPRNSVRFIVGKPIDTSEYNYKSTADMQRLADRYYFELAALAPYGQTVKIRMIEDCE